MNLKAAATLLICLFLANCASSGRNIDDAAAASISPGKTTKAEMIKAFGQPRGQAFDASGKLQMNWIYVHVGFAGIGGEQKILSVLFDQNDVVEKVSYTGGEDNGVRFGK